MKTILETAAIVLALFHTAAAQLLISGTPSKTVTLTDTNSAIGYAYNLQRSTDLVNWATLGAPLTGTSAPIRWTDTPGLTHAFYQAVQTPINTCPLYGLGFSPYLDGQSGTSNITIPVSQIQARMQAIAPFCQGGYIRNFSMINGLQVSGSVAHSLGLKAALTAWLEPENTSAEIAANQANIANLITAGTTGQADILVVGSETQGNPPPGETPLSESQLIACINEVKAAVQPTQNIPVTTADTYGAYQNFSPTLLADCDVLFVNFYPFWQPIDFADAMPALNVQYLTMEFLAPGKTVWVSETGWPSGGSTYENIAVPSPANAASYLQTFISWARYHSIPYLYFEAYNEAWKSAVEGNNGPYWGLWTSTGSMQSWVPPILSNQYYPSTWDSLINGSGTPTIAFTSVPALSDTVTTTVAGTVSHVAPFNAYVALYIYVAGFWYEKPYANAPFTAISTSGSWTNIYASAVTDFNATKIAACVYPFSYIPPGVLNSPTLSSTANALAFTIYTRSNQALQIEIRNKSKTR